MYISIYINIMYMEKRTERFFVLLQKNVAFFAFFSVLCKRILRSLRSFPFFRKEQNVLLGFISRQKLRKRTEKNVAFFKRTEKNSVPNPGFHAYKKDKYKREGKGRRCC